MFRRGYGAHGHGIVGDVADLMVLILAVADTRADVVVVVLLVFQLPGICSDLFDQYPN